MESNVLLRFRSKNFGKSSSLSKIKTYHEELNEPLKKIKYLQNVNNRPVSLRDRINILFDNTNQVSLMSYVRRMRQRIKEVCIFLKIFD